MIRSLSPAAIALAALAITAPAAAQWPDIVAQEIVADLSVDVPRITTTATLRITEETTEIYLYTPSFPEARFRAGDVELPLVEVEGTGGRAVYATLATPAAAGTELEVTLEVSGAPSCRRGGAAICAFSDDEIVLLPATMGPAWHLVGLFGADPFRARTVVRAPAHLEVVAGQGMPASVETNGATREWTFVTDHETEGLMIYARAVPRIVSPSGRAVAYADPELAEIAMGVDRALETADRVIPVYETLFGPLGVDELHIVTASDVYPFGAMGLLGNVIVPEVILGERYGYLHEQGIAHEIAHTYWGGLTSARTEEIAESSFLQEAFAEYSAWRALGEVHGPAARTSGVRMNALWYMFGRGEHRDVATLSVPGDDPLFVFVVYHKGSVFLRTLEETVGRDALTAALRALVDEGPGRLTLERFATAVETASGIDPRPLIASWLERPGFPTLTVGASFDETELALDVSIDGAFDVRLPVDLVDRDGTRARVVLDVPRGTSTHRISAERASVVAVELDPEWTMSRRIVPAITGDVSLDGVVDAHDMLEVALRIGGAMPDERRVDGRYDPLFDVDDSRMIEIEDVDAVLAAARSR
jgi:hypothetical protein